MADNPKPLGVDHPHFRLLKDIMDMNEQESEIAKSAGTEDPVEHFLRTEQLDKTSLIATAAVRAPAGLRKALPETLRREFDLLSDEEKAAFAIWLMSCWLEGFQVGYDFALKRVDRP